MHNVWARFLWRFGRSVMHRQAVALFVFLIGSATAAMALEAFRKAECTVSLPDYGRLEVLTKEGNHSVGIAQLRE